MDCLFCKIVAGQVLAQKVFETDSVLGFRDILPKAPEHILVIPKKHFASILDFGPQDAKLLGEVVAAIQDIAQQLNIRENGFRVVTNTGANAGQAVSHVHFHILGGRTLAWPPG